METNGNVHTQIVTIEQLGFPTHARVRPPFLLLDGRVAVDLHWMRIRLCFVK